MSIILAGKYFNNAVSLVNITHDLFSEQVSLIPSGHRVLI